MPASDINDADQIVITAMGAVTAVGGNVKQTTAAIEAGIAHFEEHSRCVCTPQDPGWDADLPAYVAAVPLVSPFLESDELFTRLAIPALTEVITQSGIKRNSLPKTGLFIALPVIDDSSQELNLDEQWLFELRERMGLMALRITHLAHDGNIGVFSLIDEAVNRLKNGELEQCIIGGIDSYLPKSRMAYFDQQWRVKSERNVDGFIPGEASAMFMLETFEHAINRGATPLAKIGNIGFGTEKNHFYSEQASTGAGLTQAIRASLQNEGDKLHIKTIACDLAGESYYSQELGLAQIRLGNVLNSITEISHPADSCGNIGAASGALLIVNTAQIMRQEQNKEQVVLLSTANDDGRRSALLLKNI